MRYGSNVGCPGSLHLFECLKDAILADDGNVFFSLHFSHRLQSSQPAGIGGCCDQQPAFFRMPSKEVLHLPTAFLSQAFSVHQDVSVLLQARKPRAHPLESAGDPALHQRPRLLNPQSEHSTHCPAPVTLGKMGQILPRLKSDPVIIHAKVSGVWMGNVYSDQWNPCSTDFVGDGRRDSLIDLEFDEQVNLRSEEH